MLFNHDRDEVIGKIAKAWIDNGRGMATIEFDSDEASEVIYQKVKGGTLKGVSVSKKTDINSHPHQLRHYFAEERRKEGWDLNDIRFALGHKKVETTIKYLGENNERLVEATDQYYSNNENLYQIADFL